MFTTWHNWTSKTQRSLLALFCLLALSGQITADQHIHLDSNENAECLICGHGDQGTALNHASELLAFRNNCELPATSHSAVTRIGLRYYPTRAPPIS